MFKKFLILIISSIIISAFFYQTEATAVQTPAIKLNAPSSASSVITINDGFNAWITDELVYTYWPSGNISAVGYIYFHWDPVPGAYYYIFLRDGSSHGNSDSTTGVDLYGSSSGPIYDPQRGYIGDLFWSGWEKFKTDVYSHTWQIKAVLPNSQYVYSKVIRPSSYSDLTKQLPQEKVTTVAEPINVANGNMFTSATDILIPSREIPLELSRIYNSQDYSQGSFGYGWRSNFDIRLSEQSDASVIEADEKGVYTIYTYNPDGTYTPSVGKYSILIKNPDGTFTLIRKHGRKLYFNNKGWLTKIEERNGNSLNIIRDSDGLIQEVSDSSGRKLLFTYDTQGKITQVTDPAGRIFKYEYDSSDNLVKTIDPLNNQTLYAYDSNHNLTSQTDANGRSLNFEYDSLDRAYHSWQDINTNAVTLTFDSTNKITTSTDSLGNITKYEYDDYGLVTKITDSQNKTQTFIWDSNLNKTSSTNQNGNTATFTYDTKGNLLTIKDPLNNTTTFTYESNFDLVSSITDALGNTTEFSYDANGNLLQVKDALTNTIDYTYDVLGQLTQTKDANNNAINFSYDTYGNLIQITDALNNPTNFSFDIIGNITQITDAKANSTQFSYDLLNRLTQITYPDNSSITYTYDAVGNLISFTDPNNNITTYTYDAVNRLTQVTDALLNITQYTYDTEGNRLSITDSNLNKTQYLYDTLNRLIKIIDPLNNFVLFSYDPLGNLISKTDANANTISYTYDANNRLTQIIYPDTSNISFSYDALGRRTSMADSTGTTTYSYDALSRLTGVDGPQANDTISYAYDKVGNRIQVTNPDGGITTYTYDSLNRLISLTDPQGKITTYSYDAVSNLIQMNYPNNIQTNYSFDNLNHLISLTQKIGTRVIPSYTYAYNPSGMRTKVTLANKDYILYSYDALNQLTKEEKYNRYNQLFYSSLYTYDYVNNRLTQVIDYTVKGVPKKISSQYTYNLANQLTQSKTNNLTTNYSYDNNGNLIQKTTGASATNYTYDYENRLIGITLPNSTNIIYAYDGLGRRVSKAINSQLTSYFYDVEDIISEQSPTETITYTHGPGIDNPISMLRGGNQYYYHKDGLGSITNLTNATAQSVKTYQYDAYGNILQKQGTLLNSYTYTSRELDSESGVYFYRNRYYDPKIGRFLSQDPLGMIDSLNLYAYVNNNPVNFTDPWGLSKDKVWWQQLPLLIISGAQWHYDYTRGGQRLIEIFYKGEWFRFNNLGRLVEHTGKEIGKVAGKAAKALKYLRNVKPGFFLKTPIFIIIPPELKADPSFPFYDPEYGNKVI